MLYEYNFLPVFAGAEQFSSSSQVALKPRCERVCAAEHAPRDPNCLLEHRHGLADIVECGGGVLGRPETDRIRGAAMTELGNGLSAAGYAEEALSVKEAEVSMLRRLGGSRNILISAKANLSACYEVLGRDEETLELRREVWAYFEPQSPCQNKFLSAINLSVSLRNQGRCEEAKSLLRKVLPEALRLHGPDHDTTLVIRRALVRTVFQDPESSLAELRQAEADFSDVCRRARRIFGASHPESAACEWLMGQLKAKIAARDSGGA